MTIENTAPKKQFTRKKALTLPVLKQKIEQPYFIRIMEPMKIGKKVDNQKDEAIITSVTDLQTGEIFQFLVPSVFQGILHDDYGAPRFGKIDKDDKNSPVVELVEGTHDNYVGKCFEITKLPKPSGKGYHAFTVFEVDCE